jgi:Kef-type K+ transport system membrane component KefB
MDDSLTGLLIVFACAVAIPAALVFVPRIRIPSTVLEIVAGILIGPSVLGWVDLDDPAVGVISLLGLGMLLFIAGLELHLREILGAHMPIILMAYAVSCGFALAAGLILDATGIIGSPLFVAIILASTALGVLTPILKDSGLLKTPIGQVVFAACAVAEIIPIVLLSLFFSRSGGSVLDHAMSLAIFLCIAGALGFAMAAGTRFPSLITRFNRIADTTAQIRVRETMLLLVAFAVIAERLGVELILGTFAVGLIIANTRGDLLTVTYYTTKVEAIGFGVFIPVFFVYTGMKMDVNSVFESPGAIVRVFVLLLALLIVRGLPALLFYPRVMSRREALGVGLFQSTSLSFPLAAVALGTAIGEISSEAGTALIAAAMLSVVILPPLGDRALRPFATAAVTEEPIQA